MASDRIFSSRRLWFALYTFTITAVLVGFEKIDGAAFAGLGGAIVAAYFANRAYIEGKQ